MNHYHNFPEWYYNDRLILPEWFSISMDSEKNILWYDQGWVVQIDLKDGCDITSTLNGKKGVIVSLYPIVKKLSEGSDKNASFLSRISRK